MEQNFRPGRECSSSPTGATTSFSRLGRIGAGDISGGVEPQMREPHKILASRGSRSYYLRDYKS